MTPRQIQLVRDSFSEVIPVAREFAATFYAQLFVLNPKVRSMFASDMAVQEQKFVDMLSAIATHLDEPGRLADIYGGMGRRHLDYGVLESHFDDVGAALLRTLKTAMGIGWDDELEEAWGAVYGDIAESMIASTRSDALDINLTAGRGESSDNSET